MEAMASGAALVSTRVGGIPKLIEHEANGLLCDSEDPDGLRLAIIRLVEDRSLRARLVSRALEDVVDHSLQTQIDRTIAIYRRVIAARREPPAQPQ